VGATHLGATMNLAALTILAAFLFVCATAYRDTNDLAQPVDSYICLQAETNRIPNSGCRFSRAEKP
jgi:hypothetical protein